MEDLTIAYQQSAAYLRTWLKSAGHQLFITEAVLQAAWAIQAPVSPEGLLMEVTNNLPPRRS